MSGGWEDLEAIPTDIRGAQQAVEDLNKLCLRVLGSEDGTEAE